MNDPDIPRVSAEPDMYVSEPDSTGTGELVVLLAACEIAAGGLLLAWLSLGGFDAASEGRQEARLERSSGETLVDAVASRPESRTLGELPMRDIQRVDAAGKR